MLNRTCPDAEPEKALTSSEIDLRKFQFDQMMIENQKLIDDIVLGVAAEDLRIENFLSDLNQAGKFGRTPLMTAATTGAIEVIRALLRYGAQVGATGIRRLTALHEAGAHDHVAVVELLLDNGAAIDSISEDGVTPLMCAAASGDCVPRSGV